MSGTTKNLVFGFDTLDQSAFITYLQALVSIPARVVSAVEGEPSALSSSALFNLTNLFNPDAFMFTDDVKLSSTSLDVSRIKELVKLGSLDPVEGVELVRLYSHAFPGALQDSVYQRTVRDVSYIETESYTRTNWCPVVSQVMAHIVPEALVYDAQVVDAFYFVFTKLNSSQRDWVQVFNGDSDRKLFKEFYRWVAQALSVGHLTAVEAMMLSSAKNPLRSVMDNYAGLVTAYQGLTEQKHQYDFTRCIASVFVHHGESVVDFAELAALVADEHNAGLSLPLLEKMVVQEYVPTDNHGDVFTLEEKLEKFSVVLPSALRVPDPVA
jgi:hypothetical protein